MPDMRDDMILHIERVSAERAHTFGPTGHIEAVLDSIPPGSYKREDGTWVRLERSHLEPWDLVQPDDVPVYTEVDHAE